MATVKKTAVRAGFSGELAWVLFGAQPQLATTTRSNCEAQCNMPFEDRHLAVVSVHCPVAQLLRGPGGYAAALHVAAAAALTDGFGVTGQDLDWALAWPM